MKRIEDEDLDIPIARRGETLPEGALELPGQLSSCPICQGAGYLVREGPDGRADLVPCACKRRQLEENDYQQLELVSNLGPFTDHTFETFDAAVPGVREAYEAARAFSDDPEGWLLLTGNLGCGKTHLAAAIANAAVRRHVKTLFTVVPDLLDHLRASYAPNSPVRYDERIEAVRTVYLLILDDLGTENATPWAREKLYQIVNYRYNYELPTVITTNRDLKEIEERIRSRIWDKQLCRHILIQAEDYRRRRPRRRH
jgi:DNA replication protein DnaC